MLRPVFSFSLLAGLVLVSSTCSGANPPLTAPDSLPVAFEPNVGQAPAGGTSRTAGATQFFWGKAVLNWLPPSRLQGSRGLARGYGSGF
jgi:hypothetical protein